MAAFAGALRASNVRHHRRTEERDPLVAEQSRRAHPDIFTRAVRRCISGTVRHRVENLGIDWYRDQFEGWNGEPIVGEATPGYMIWRHHPAYVAQRMKDHHPDVKLIAILRNPVDRAQSAMLHHIRRHRIPRDARLVDVVRELRPPESDWFCLVSGGWYAASLEPFLDRFGDQLLVLFHDQVAVDPAARLRVGAPARGCRSTDFVPGELSRVVFSNQGGRAGRRSPLSADDRVELWDYFRDDVARLERMLGVDLSRWTPDAVPAEPELQR